MRRRRQERGGGKREEEGGGKREEEGEIERRQEEEGVGDPWVKEAYDKNVSQIKAFLRT